jgi:DNA-binding NarL/FixJ family response regulator
MTEGWHLVDAGDAAFRPSTILVVDDYEPFRGFVSSTLRKHPKLVMIGEARDGVEAVQQAETLQPDLVVLDIGLPKMNGIEAAHVIREVAPNAKIVFLTQETSLEVVQEALSLGARGYVVKAQAHSELLGALEAVLDGKRFVSNGLPMARFGEAQAGVAPRNREAG